MKISFDCLQLSKKLHEQTHQYRLICQTCDWYLLVINRCIMSVASAFDRKRSSTHKCALLFKKAIDFTELFAFCMIEGWHICCHPEIKLGLKSIWMHFEVFPGIYMTNTVWHTITKFGLIRFRFKQANQPQNQGQVFKVQGQVWMNKLVD